MASIKEIYLKIASIQNTQKVTKAMEVVAASKMRKTKERMAVNLPYLESIRSVINHLILANLEYKHPYLNGREVKRICYLIISTDRGLCSALNTNLFKKLLLEMKEWTDDGVYIDLMLIGYKAVLFFNSIDVNIIYQVSGIGDYPSISDFISPVKIIFEAYNEGHMDKLYVVTNKFINSVTQVPTITQLLPLLPITGKKVLKKRSWDYLYEPDPKTLLDSLLYRYIESQVYQSVVENLVSEKAARMLAMKTATDNGANLLRDLQLVYNKARQAHITQEVTEIISGAAVV